MHNVVFNHDNEDPFLDLLCLVTSCTLSDDQVLEMHQTDLKTGESMDEAALLQLPTQTATSNIIVSETEEEDSQLMNPVTELLLEIAKTLWDLTLDHKEHPHDTLEQCQFLKRVRNTEFETGIQISNYIPRDTKATKKHCKSWTFGSQVQLDAEIELLGDHQLGQCLAHHQVVLKLQVDWFPVYWGVKADSHVMICCA